MNGGRASEKSCQQIDSQTPHASRAAKAALAFAPSGPQSRASPQGQGSGGSPAFGARAGGRPPASISSVATAAAISPEVAVRRGAAKSQPPARLAIPPGERRRTQGSGPQTVVDLLGYIIDNYVFRSTLLRR